MGRLAPPRPLTADDKREDFDSGKTALNDWFVRHAWRNQRDGTSRTSIVSDGDRIVGFVALSTGQIEREWLAKPDQRNKPNPLPILLLGQLAVHIDFHGRGVGKSLLRFAVGNALALLPSVGCFGILTHPIDDDARSFYAYYGFSELPFDPKRSMLLRIADIGRSVFETPPAN